MDKTTIIVCCHKPDENIRTGYPYLPIQGGKALHPELDLGFIGDDTGDNISEKNPEWCELTSLYWAWKNLPRTKYFGLAHYRRYIKADVSDDKIDGEMGDYDMIVTRRCVTTFSNAMHLKFLTSREDFWLFADTFLAHYPEYGNEFIDCYFNQNWYYPFNLFLCRWEVFEEYCEFIMPVLKETDKRLRLSQHARQRRVIGFTGEQMLTLFIMCKKKRVKVKDCEATFVQDQGSGQKAFKSVLHRKVFFTMQKMFPLRDTLVSLSFKAFSSIGKTFIIADDDVRLWFKKDGISLKVLDKPFFYNK